MTEEATNITVEVNRSAFGETRLCEEHLAPLGDGQVRLRIDRFALTANNITYAVIGDLLGYWEFFPTADTWGRVPAMGWADVVQSTHPDVGVGGRYYGWYPMARFVDLTASVTNEGLRDDGPHRLAHAPVYRSYVETTRDPMYPEGVPGELGEAEDRHALLRGLFLTGFLADASLADDEYYGADNVIVLSASSKTAIGFAQRAAERDLDVIGVTSAGNADFVRSLGYYDHVVTYDELAELPVTTSVAVDMAGDAVALAALHERLGDALKYSMTIGKSHHDSPRAEITAGPTPQLFFAPTAVGQRLAEWGAEEYHRRCATALRDFVTASESWLTVQRTTGAAEAEDTYHAVYDGKVAPSVGRIVSLHP